MHDDAVAGRKRARLLGRRERNLSRACRGSSDINNPRASASQCAASPAASTPRLSRSPTLSHSPKGRNRRTKPSTQPGTPRWTHPLVSHWKHSPRVEAARNSIPTPSTSFLSRFSLSLCLLASLRLCLRHPFSTRQWLQGRIRPNLLKTKARCKIYPSLSEAVCATSH